jgi:3-hydroxyisobutyrate dehydrogenase-like beta-hydroxyacid dehydrogenase
VEFSKMGLDNRMNLWHIPYIEKINFYQRKKDLDIALGAGRAFGVPFPVTALVEQMLEALIGSGQGDFDHSALLTHLEDLAGHQLGAQ